jgi:hypothetical protein
LCKLQNKSQPAAANNAGQAVVFHDELIETLFKLSCSPDQSDFLCVYPRNSQFQKTYFTIKKPYQAAIPGVFHGALYEKARVPP